MTTFSLKRGIRLFLIVILFLGTIALTSLGAIMTTANAQANKPTIVFVHGAFAESSSWNGVLPKLIAKGYPTVAVANPLRSVKNDADYVASALKGIKGSIVLVGHSYGGTVITNAANGNKNVKALVYVAGYAPEAGETTAELSGRYPGSTLGPALAPPVTLPDGGKDLYIQQDKFRAPFAADVPTNNTQLMASTQRPVTEAALNEASSAAPAWKSIPSWFIYGDRDLIIPPALHASLAKRANSKETVVVKGASHVVMVSHPDAVATLIKKAAEAS
ncbi:MAG: alpha/beta fold hydrolase [Nostoc sp. DedVER02]|uniref:alpha/beta fold hydrolase n=1 Tax=unclassified Nostoc TaxID=2593658 RepID=UPI002AD4609C|nr:MULTISPECIES: alpha/beta hydrolase [unclassified Nostoc]MDZ7989072.1 alpha/beta hydrolase [Nostoc sp. DedVER02]MDZ8111618.1 alpha/beta hydrolase [Nostoc sp. DedVER01b]